MNGFSYKNLEVVESADVINMSYNGAKGFYKTADYSEIEIGGTLVSKYGTFMMV